MVGRAGLITLSPLTHSPRRDETELYPCWPWRTLSCLNIDLLVHWGKMRDTGMERKKESGKERIKRDQLSVSFSAVLSLLRL